MARLVCPKCKTVVDVAPGARPACPACGFGRQAVGAPVQVRTAPPRPAPDPAARSAPVPARPAPQAPGVRPMPRRNRLVVASLAVAALLVVGAMAAAAVWLLGAQGGAVNSKAADAPEPSGEAVQDQATDTSIATQGLADLKSMFSRIASPRPAALPAGVGGMTIEVSGTVPEWPAASRELSRSTLSQVGHGGRAFVVLAPTDVVAGQPFPLTVTAVDSEGEPDPAYRGWVVLAAGTGEAFNASHTFTADDAGTWETEFVLDRPGVGSVAAVQVGETNTTGLSGLILVHLAGEGAAGPEQRLNLTFGTTEITRIDATLASRGITVEIRLWCHPGGIVIEALGHVSQGRPSVARSCLEQSGGDGFEGLGVPTLGSEPGSAVLRNGVLEATFRGSVSAATIWMEESPSGWHVREAQVQAGELEATLRPAYAPLARLDLPVADRTEPALVEASEIQTATSVRWRVERIDTQVPVADLEARLYAAGGGPPVATFSLADGSDAVAGYTFRFRGSDGLEVGISPELGFSGGARLLREGDTLLVSNPDWADEEVELVLFDTAARMPLQTPIGGGSRSGAGASGLAA